MIFTNCGKLGDALLCLPVLSWYYKTYNEKVIFALSDHFPYSKDAKELLSMQECIKEVVYFPYDVNKTEDRQTDYNMGRYHILKENFAGCEYENDKIYSLGFYKFPDDYFPRFYAKEYDLGVDYDFKLNYGNPDYTYSDQIVKVDRYDAPMLNNIDAIPLLSSNGMVKNLQLAAGAKEIVTFTTGFSVMVTLAKIPVTLYQPLHLRQHHTMCFEINGGIKEVFI